jgi:hypothetical protein
LRAAAEVAAHWIDRLESGVAQECDRAAAVVIAELPAAAAAARATPLTELLEPLELDPLTAVDDYRFADLLANERNVPSELRSEIANLYQPRSLSGR